MKNSSWVEKRKRVNKHQTRGGRWGPPKVHMVESRGRIHGVEVYELACHRLSDLEVILGGVDEGNVSRSEPVTCKKCRKKYGLDVDTKPVKRKVRVKQKKKKRLSVRSAG